MFNVNPALFAPVALPASLEKASSVILYRGPSMLDGAPIVVVATGLRDASSNAKTGAMVQTYIIRDDMAPIEAVRTGADASICGDCPHRGDGTGKGRSCYVTLIHGPRAVYSSFKRGIYPVANPHQAKRLFAGKMIRLGTYGDPAAVPQSVWTIALGDAAGWTGYTHQWRKVSPSWAALVMASADSEADMNDAHDLGYRTFRVTAEPFQNVKGREVVCPASEERGKRASCIECRACMGTSGKARVSIQIAAHGGGAKHVR